MSHFGMFCPPVTGHLDPSAALARTLRGRGHRVTMFQVAELEARVRSAELEFIALGPDRFPPGTLANSIAKLAALSGIRSLRYAIECERQMSQLILDFAPDAVRGAGIDALLVDQNEPAGATVAEHLKLPFVSICTSLPLNREPLIPPPFVDWDWRDSPWARWRNQIGYAISDYFIRPIQEILNQYRRRWNLAPVRSPDDSFSPTAQLAQMPQVFDFPRKRLPAGFHYLGPWFDDFSSRISFPFEKLNGRPLIYASLGTLQSRHSRYFGVIAEACAGLDTQLVVSLGDPGGKDPPALPGDPLVVNYAPPVELLSRAALTITHSGMNTTMQSLHFGVPMIAIPLAHDQPAIAARLARTGAGVVIPPRQLSSARLRHAVESVLPRNSGYRESAGRLRDAIRQSGGRDRAAGILESAIRG